MKTKLHCSKRRQQQKQWAEEDNLARINEREEWGDVTGLDALSELSVPGNLALFLRLKTWTVPLSLETANHWAFEENAKL